MLVTTPPSIGVNAKQISLATTYSDQRTIYTVPTGKKFIGYVSINSPASYTTVYINGVQQFISMLSSTGGVYLMSQQLVLTAGTTVANSHANQVISIIGIESDV